MYANQNTVYIWKCFSVSSLKVVFQSSRGRRCSILWMVVNTGHYRHFALILLFTKGRRIQYRNMWHAIIDSKIWHASSMQYLLGQQCNITILDFRCMQYIRIHNVRYMYLYFKWKLYYHKYDWRKIEIQIKHFRIMFGRPWCSIYLNRYIMKL